MVQIKQETFSKHLLLVTATIVSKQTDAFALSTSYQAADALAEHILTSRLKLLYSCLSSEKAKANAALHLLVSIAERGGHLVTELCRRFDFELPALYKLARAPR